MPRDIPSPLKVRGWQVTANTRPHKQQPRLVSPAPGLPPARGPAGATPPDTHRRGGTQRGSPGSSHPSSGSTSRNSSEPGGCPAPSRCCSCPGSSGAGSRPWHPPGSRRPAASPRRAAAPTCRWAPRAPGDSFPLEGRLPPAPPNAGQAARAGPRPHRPCAGRGDKARSLLLHQPSLARLFAPQPG